MREVLEETGLEVRLFDQEELVVDEKHARSIPRPYICLLEDEEDHQHVDFVFVGRPVKGELVENKDETNGIQWFSAEELATIEMLADARQIAKKLLNEKSTIFCSDKSTRGENDHVSGGRVGTAQAV